LSDFGLATQIKTGEKLFEGVGSPNYIAPEVLMCLEDDLEPAGYDMRADLWSSGCILYILLCGMPPFYSNDTDELYDSILEGSFDFPDDISLSRSAKALVNKILVTDAETRIPLEDILNDEWMVADATDLAQNWFFFFFFCFFFFFFFFDFFFLPLLSLHETQNGIKQFNSRRKWRSSILAVVASNRLKSMFDFKDVANLRKSRRGSVVTPLDNAGQARARRGSIPGLGL
jgi:serine/threonine protein kinase